MRPQNDGLTFFGFPRKLEFLEFFKGLNEELFIFMCLTISSSSLYDDYGVAFRVGKINELLH